MRSNVKLGKVSGIEIGLHYSWFIIAALIVFSLVERFHEAHASTLQGIVFRSQLVHALQQPSEMRLPPAYQQLLYGTSKVAEGRVGRCPGFEKSNSETKAQAL